MHLSYRTTYTVHKLSETTLPVAIVFFFEIDQSHAVELLCLHVFECCRGCPEMLYL